MGNSTRNTGVVPGQSTEKRIGTAIVACVSALGIFLAALLIFTPTAGAHGQTQMQNQNVVTVSIRDFFFDPA